MQYHNMTRCFSSMSCRVVVKADITQLQRPHRGELALDRSNGSAGSRYGLRKLDCSSVGVPRCLRSIDVRDDQTGSLLSWRPSTQTISGGSLLCCHWKHGWLCLVCSTTQKRTLSLNHICNIGDYVHAFRVCHLKNRPVRITCREMTSNRHDVVCCSACRAHIGEPRVLVFPLILTAGSAPVSGQKAMDTVSKMQKGE